MDGREKERLQELSGFNIMDTLPEKEYDEIVELASAICGTPISLISLLDSERQWFKSKRGIDVSEMPRELSFCSHAIQDPEQILIVDDPFNDPRFKDNPLVTGDPNIRFYAGAPLRTDTGNALGTLCVIDNRPRQLTDQQKDALQLLSRRVMDRFLERKELWQQKKLVENSSILLKHLTDRAPGAIFQFEKNSKGGIRFPFVSSGISEIHPRLTANKLKDDPHLGFSFIHHEDIGRIQKAFANSQQTLNNWDEQYRIVLPDNTVRWNWIIAHPEKMPDDKIVWYGSIQDITESVQYIQTLEDICFDISHIIRRPVATILGLAKTLEIDQLSEKKVSEYAGYFKSVAEELDEHIFKLSKNYNARRKVKTAAKVKAK